MEKTLRELKEKNFSGVVVDIKDVVTEEYLSVDTVCDDYGVYYSDEYHVIRKRSKTVIKCAKVYYALGKSRLVPLDKLIYVEEAKRKDS